MIAQCCLKKWFWRAMGVCYHSSQWTWRLYFFSVNLLYLFLLPMLLEVEIKQIKINCVQSELFILGIDLCYWYYSLDPSLPTTAGPTPVTKTCSCHCFRKDFTPKYKTRWKLLCKSDSFTVSGTNLNDLTMLQFVKDRDENGINVNFDVILHTIFTYTFRILSN